MGNINEELCVFKRLLLVVQLIKNLPGVNLKQGGLYQIPRRVGLGGSWREVFKTEGAYI